MSLFLANQPFITHCYRQGFLDQCEDFGDWWQMWCMGPMLNEM